MPHDRSKSSPLDIDGVKSSHLTKDDDETTLTRGKILDAYRASANRDVSSPNSEKSGSDAALTRMKPSEKVRLTIEISTEELEAIREYARCCEEPVGQLVKKIIIREATLADG